jgi:SAM-dependent methyltransferase
MATDWGRRADELSAQALTQGDPTAWFDRLYAAGEAGEISMPWERDGPHVLLEEWLGESTGNGRRAVVVGCGLGADAEYLSARGFDVVGFDIAATAVRLAAQRHPGTSVDYRVADLLALPPEWDGAFDLVVEIYTVQALPDPPRLDAARAVSTLVAPGGTLLAVEFRYTGVEDLADGPPFALPRSTMETLAGDRLRMVSLEELDGPRWRAELTR